MADKPIYTLLAVAGKGKRVPETRSQRKKARLGVVQGANKGRSSGSLVLTRLGLFDTTTKSACFRGSKGKTTGRLKGRDGASKFFYCLSYANLDMRACPGGRGGDLMPAGLGPSAGGVPALRVESGAAEEGLCSLLELQVERAGGMRSRLVRLSGADLSAAAWRFLVTEGSEDGEAWWELRVNCFVLFLQT